MHRQAKADCNDKQEDQVSSTSNKAFPVKCYFLFPSDSVENSKDRIKEWYSAKSAKKSFDWKSTISISSSTKTSKKSSDDSKAGTSSSMNSGKMTAEKKVAATSSSQGSEADRDSKTGSVLNGTWKYEFGALTLSPVGSKSV